MDDAPVRRLRHAPRTRTALPLPARARPDGALHRLRHADPHGLDSDHPRAAERWAARASRSTRWATWRSSSRGIPLDEVSTSMTINGPAAVVLAFYVVAAERQGVPAERLRGTIQNDILKEYIAQKEWIFPPAPALRLDHRHDRVGARARCRAGTPSRSPATTSARRARRPRRSSPSRSPTASTYVEQALARGLDVDAFAPRLSFFFNAHIDFFEEIAKFRAARRIWAREMRDALRRPRSALVALRFHTQTAGVLADRAAAARTTSCAPRSRRWPACSAARSRCTRTRWTRRSRCRREEAASSRCARSR